MEYFNVKEIIDYICLTFGKAMPKESKIEFFCEELDDVNVNDAAMAHIKRYFAGLDSCPVNLVKAIRRSFFEWQQAQPETHKSTACSVCNGYGLLIREERDPDDGQLYSYTSRCPACENWRLRTGEGTPVAQLHKYQYKQNGSMPGKAA